MFDVPVHGYVRMTKGVSTRARGMVDGQNPNVIVNLECGCGLRVGWKASWLGPSVGLVFTVRLGWSEGAGARPPVCTWPLFAHVSFRTGCFRTGVGSRESEFKRCLRTANGL